MSKLTAEAQRSGDVQGKQFALRPRVSAVKSLLLSQLLGFWLVAAFLALATLTAQETTPQQLLSQADQVLHQMSDLTGLPIRGVLRKQVVNRTEIRKYLAENLHREMTPADLHAQEAMLRAFGLVKRDFNLEDFLLTFYTEQAAGFYDPHTKTMYIADWIPEDMQGMVLAHELTHALQDQSWNLEQFLRAAHDNDDATSARLAVVEGYATAAMLAQYTAPLDLGQMPSLQPLMEMVIHQQFEEYPSFSKAPYFARLQALFPYVVGIGFTQQSLRQGGWKSFEPVFQDPPEATKQIYDPPSYFSHQPLPHVALEHPSALEHVPGLIFLSENVLGELGVRSVVGQLLSEEEAESLGKEWSGDRYLLYEHGDNLALVVRTRWSNSEASSAFFNAYRRVLNRKYPELSGAKSDAGDSFRAKAANGGVLMLCLGNEVRWAEGVPPGQIDAMHDWLRSL